MSTVRVERTIPAPIEDVFAVLSDHAGYTGFRGITEAELLERGSPEPNGLGALRRIKSPLFEFEEEITHFEAPTRFDYLIRKVNIPLEHDGGSLSFEERDGGTHVDWVSSWKIAVPVVGGALGPLSVVLIRAAFKEMLRGTEKRVASGEPAPARR